MAEIIDGKAISKEIREEIKSEISSLKSESDKTPGLAVILVGEDPASQVYVRNKKRSCEEVGINSFEYKLPESTSEEELLQLIDKLNKDDKVNGILVQLPVPDHMDDKNILNAIDYKKDVDGFHPINVGKMVVGDDDCYYPCTPHGCQVLINRFVKDTKGKHVVVVGRSNIVGKPIANMMVQKNDMANCIVTVCHSADPDIGKYTRQADILVAAVGIAEFITADMVKDGVVVIDVGINRKEDPANPGKNKLFGDVNFEEVSKKASAITPVPGGVGPMTITMLLKNTVESFKRANNLN